MHTVPLDAETRQRLAQWEDMIKDSEYILAQNCAVIGSCKEDFEDKSKYGELIEGVKSSMGEVCKLNNTFNEQKRVLNWCRSIEKNEDKIDYNKEFNQKIKDILKNDKFNLESDPMYKRFIEKIEEHDDDDFQVEVELNFIDPITKQTIVQPVKGQECGHVFDMNSIMSMFKGKKPIRCPNVGCPHKLNKTDIIEDQHLTQQFERFKKKQ